jgi:hypothetical protein
MCFCNVSPGQASVPVLLGQTLQVTGLDVVAERDVLAPTIQASSRLGMRKPTSSSSTELLRESSQNRT